MGAKRLRSLVCKYINCIKHEMNEQLRKKIKDFLVETKENKIRVIKWIMFSLDYLFIFLFNFNFSLQTMFTLIKKKNLI